jgi:LysM repeat protein
MTTRPSALIQAACISLLIMLVPGTAAPQEQKEPSSGQQPEQTVAEPAQPQSEPTGTTSGTTGGASQLQAAPPKVEPQAAAPAAGNATPASEENTEYVIKQGDTLWDISNTYLKDPFLWPIIWKSNPSIANPDKIYAGSKLAIPSIAPLEQAMQAPSEEAPKTQLVEKQAPVSEEAKEPEAKQTTEAAVSPAPEPVPAEGLESALAVRPRQVQPAEEKTGGGNRLILPEEQVKPIIDKYAMLSAGFVNGMESAGVIIGHAGEVQQATFGYDDSVYVKFDSPGNVNIGDKFLIYASQGTVKHPRTGKDYGQLIHGLGILRVTAKDPSTEVCTARITLSFDTIEKNNQLTPYQEPALVYPSPAKKKDISGYVLAVENQRAIVGQMDFVYIDKGSADGVDPGDNFVVYADTVKAGEPRVKIGEVQVIIVKERSSTAVVRRSTDTLITGNAVDFEK